MYAPSHYVSMPASELPQGAWDAQILHYLQSGEALNFFFHVIFSLFVCEQKDHLFSTLWSSPRIWSSIFSPGWDIPEAVIAHRRPKEGESRQSEGWKRRHIWDLNRLHHPSVKSIIFALIYTLDP